MTKITLRNHLAIPLYTGEHHTTAQAIEHCITHNITLDGLNICGTDLSHANFDGWSVKGAIFRHCNLQGANMSEIYMKNCDFSDTNLEDACFCYSDLMTCIFTNAHFASTDFSEAKLDGSQFSDPPPKNLNLSNCYSTKNLLYISTRKNVASTHLTIEILNLNKLIMFLNKTGKSNIITILKYATKIWHTNEDLHPRINIRD
ncbi:MAG TPA: pentapeptide repeat-containing protein [Alphaproteobacteria bacterium]|nr:pentapeptide repeat-containing protein [Alphaproteobacteria bacterium]